MSETVRRTFRTLSARPGGGLRHDLFPMRLWHKAKKVGIWNPRDIDFTTDREDWQGLSELEQTVPLHLTCRFQRRLQRIELARDKGLEAAFGGAEA